MWHLSDKSSTTAQQFWVQLCNAVTSSQTDGAGSSSESAEKFRNKNKN